MGFSTTLEADTSCALALDLQSHSKGGAPILGALSLKLMPGETLALTGPSGIGKTTLLRILAQLEEPIDGTLQPAKRLAFVFQEPTLLKWRSARENLTLTTGCSIAEAEASLASVGLSGQGDLRPDALSLGQQRRLALARAIALRPSVLLMDEPFVSLDPQLGAEMMDLFRTLRSNSDMATILVTHEPKEAEALADRILELRGTPAQPK
ncbi:MAG: NitT/TauT family transport system ATP-binding protein [Halocynthiibacter sp.]|jgi:ABC-type nitrate/sulfonate/bicarbonate transport system ATPase subunit